MVDQALVPGELVVEFRAGLRVAVGRIERGDDDAADRRLDVAGLGIGGIAGKLAAVSTGSAPRARMATPFHADWPRHTAP